MPQDNRLLYLIKFLCIALVCLLAGTAFVSTPWGFFGHRKINRMAVFSLPQEMLGFYKKNIEYISEHAVDPDKRRYALKNEFTRHYIDIDHWDTIPFLNVPRNFAEATMKFGKLCAINPVAQDTIIFNEYLIDALAFYYDQIYFDRYSIEVPISDLAQVNLDSLQLPPGYTEVLFKNELVAYGALPYFLKEFYLRLVKAFESRESKVILKISADIGHYIADGHVPLHTTKNYNGQLTDQLGIHAFWESRLPELFADDNYDFLVGKAEYIEDIEEFIWQMVEDSHALLPEVLNTEKSLSESYPEDQQFCFDERLERTIRTQCPEYSEAYHLAMDGMVEARMQDAIHAISSFWYSAWVDAGQPDMDNLDNFELTEEEVAEFKELENVFKNFEIKGRDHSN